MSRVEEVSINRTAGRSLTIILPILVWVALPIVGWGLIYFEAIHDERAHFRARAALVHAGWGALVEPSCAIPAERLGVFERSLSLPKGETALVIEGGQVLSFSSATGPHPLLAPQIREAFFAAATTAVAGREFVTRDRDGEEWWVSARSLETAIHPTCRFATVVVTHVSTRLAAIHDRVRIAIPATIAWLVFGVAIGFSLRKRTERRMKSEREEELSQALHRLHVLHEFSERLVDSVPVGVIAVDKEMRITGLNHTQETLSSVKAIDTLGRKVSDVFPAPSTGPAADFYFALAKTLDEGQALDKVYKAARTPFCVDEKGRYRVRIAPLFSDGTRSAPAGAGGIAGAVILQEDQSTEARLEEVAFEAEKLSSVGVLAAGVAHEINNPLTSILGYSKLLLESKSPDDPDHGALTLVAQEATRVQEIVRNLLDFARPQRGERSPIEINTVVQRSLGLVAPQLRRRKVAVETMLATDIPWTLADGKALSQVFVNLFTNALRAMESGGTLTVKTEVTHRAGPEGAVIGIVVEDTGTGIAPHDLPRIFDPFYTTHSRAGGTGLGLAISRGIVEEHRGKITVESEIGKGTRFTIYLPVLVAE